MRSRTAGIVPMKPRTMPNEIGGEDGGGNSADRGEGEQRRMPPDTAPDMACHYSPRARIDAAEKSSANRTERITGRAIRRYSAYARRKNTEADTRKPLWILHFRQNPAMGFQRILHIERWRRGCRR